MNNLAEKTREYSETSFPKKIKQVEEYDSFEKLLDSFIPQTEKGMKSFEFGICPATFQHVPRQS